MTTCFLGGIEFEIHDSRLLWFDHDLYIVKVIHVVTETDNRKLAAEGLSEPGVFISHNPFSTDLDYYVGISHFKGLGIRSLSDAQVVIFNKSLEELKIRYVSREKIPDIDFIKVDISKRHESSYDAGSYIQSLTFNFNGSEPPLCYGA